MANAQEAIEIQPLLAQYCGDCHSRDHAEAEIDLSGFRTLADIRTGLPVWEKVRSMLEGDQMPPPEAPQPTPAEKAQMRDWVRRVLADFAREQAGDPGPVMLRRLTNAEYNYTIRDLTGIESLDPTREFPIDGAAGEGFTNVGSGQGMSPSLVHKYLDAAKEVASHVVLLPDGLRFSRQTTRRDQTDELVRRIQEFYRRYTTDGGGMTVNLDGNPLMTNQGGVLPIESYLRATLAERVALQNGEITFGEVAAARGLSTKYLRILWEALNGGGSPPGPLLSEIRRHWRVAREADAPQLAAHIARWQSVLWKYNSIGHIGRDGGATAWLKAVTPVTASHEIRVPLPSPGDDGDVTVHLTARGFWDDDPRGAVIWRRPRLEFAPNAQGQHPAPLALRDVRQVVGQVEHLLDRELPRTTEYLDALVALRAAPDTFHEITAQGRLNPHLLERWAALAGVAIPGPRKITGHFRQKLVRVNGDEAINGWAHTDLPSLLANHSDAAIPIGTLTVPARGVTVHPSPTLDAAVIWQSPVDSRINLEGLIADADDHCGNGVSWRLELQTPAGRRALIAGEFDDGGNEKWQLKSPLELSTGDLLVLVISPRGGDHSCDTTHVRLTLTEHGGQKRRWDLADDAVDRVLLSNPLPDRYGHADVWHFCAKEGTPGPAAPLVPDSSLARWQSALTSPAQSAQQIEELAQTVQHVLTTSAGTALSDADLQLRQQLLSWHGPLVWLALARIPGGETDGPSSRFGVDPALFGRREDGAAADAADLTLESPHSLEVRLPSQLAQGASLVATGVLDAAGDDACVQLQILSGQPAPAAVPAVPVLVPEGTQGVRVLDAFEEFRQLFPPALCYVRIVPVDEVVTLTLYHREDDHLKRLMLEASEAEELDRLWKELRFVSQEPLRLVVAFEQISEFATQDRPDLVEAFAPLRQPILDRAEEFQKEMVAAEPAHVENVIRLADRAWRRPLTSDQQQDLRSVYQQLRDSELSHEKAIQLLMARVLTAPAFLYKLETPAAGADPGPVSENELAARLSYFLWSSLPDENLRQASEGGQLSEDDFLIAQTQRMLRDARSRRLAIHFACQWLHVRDFDQLVEKNEQLYPEFTHLRAHMYEETVRFFEDLFRNNGSILDILQADHTYLNSPLAEHYGLSRLSDEGWQRVEGLRGNGRGGILGMASVLASQSGASRTSPILRGTWVSETLLGERLPKPPPGIPTLPETVPQNLTARQLVELHSSAPGCATCHRRIDPYGFALEQFDTVGRSRPEATDTRTTLIDGVEIQGLGGLRDYLVHVRREAFIRQFCRKLLGYALGREVQLSDEPLLDEIHDRLKQDGYRFSTAVEAIVTSRQFRDIRGQDHPVPEEPAVDR